MGKIINSEDICFMDNLLTIEDFYSFVKINGGEIKNRYDKLPNILKKYLIICRSITGNLNTDINKFYYEFVYNYNIYRDSENFIFNAFYRILWNVEKISDIVKKYNIPIEEVSINDLHKVMTRETLRNIKEEYLSVAEKNNEPICIIKFEPYCRLKSIINLPEEYKDLLIIDGNHRLHAKFMKNEKCLFKFLNRQSDRIKAYVLSPKMHMELMCNDEFILVYKINANINFLIEYTTGSISESQLEQRLYEV
ncbi:hypothetical protein [Clostridium botulinum]|uniref:hypothetical protein n=1 Tax=Clostridium botulinum TaxID=1491 RepID=UPI000774D9EC|nr:hypothetical protein [Clostridium botulinum]NFL87392.1 hypothetical protein [Clostridium botulinum]NFO21729.1 hypothetical protein [Clostridium botulinum]